MTKLPRLHSKLKNNIFMFAKHNCYHILIHITSFPLVRNISWKNHRISIKLWLCKLQILQICCFVFKITNNQITYTYYYYINSISKFWRIKTDTLSNIITKKIYDLILKNQFNKFYSIYKNQFRSLYTLFYRWIIKMIKIPFIFGKKCHRIIVMVPYLMRAIDMQLNLYFNS